MSGYPPGYHDPEWDGTEEQFAEIVLPARTAALEGSLSQLLADAGFPELRFEFAGADDRDHCLHCGAEVDHHLGCPDDPNPDYEAEAEARGLTP